MRLSPVLATALLVACTSASTHPAASAPKDAGENDGGATIDFTPSNVDLSKIDFTGVGDVVFGTDQTIETSNGGVLGSQGSYKYQEQTQAGGPTLGIFAVRSLTVSAGATVSVEGADAFVVVALTTITIDGKVYANSQASPSGRTGPGVLDQPDMANTDGLGAGGGAAGSGDSSASGAGYCGEGGKGASSTGGDPPQGGPTNGNAAIIPLIAGSNGGEGGVGAGGDGGGAVQFVAGSLVSIGGVVHVGGRGGWNAGVLDTTGDLTEQGSGGGSGGSILIEAPTVEITGTLAANGGGGGGSVPGADATPDIQEAMGGKADDTHAAGGNGSSASAGNGYDGQAANMQTSGGGGGGAGRIRVNTRPGGASIDATLTPPLGPCATQGTF